jgi:hypothetical protein
MKMVLRCRRQADREFAVDAIPSMVRRSKQRAYIYAIRIIKFNQPASLAQW